MNSTYGLLAKADDSLDDWMLSMFINERRKHIVDLINFTLHKKTEYSGDILRLAENYYSVLSKHCIVKRWKPIVDELPKNVVQVHLRTIRNGLKDWINLVNSLTSEL